MSYGDTAHTRAEKLDFEGMGLRGFDEEDSPGA
jgi:hypothetical protein